MPALQRLAALARRTHRPLSPDAPSTYRTILKKIEGIKEAGAYSEDLSKVLREVETTAKSHHKTWKQGEVRIVLPSGLRRSINYGSAICVSFAGVMFVPEVAKRLSPKDESP